MIDMPVLPPPIGFPLLPVPDEAGRLNWPSLTESIEQMIRVILQTRRGEQLMRPRFGVGLQEFVGYQDSMATRTKIQERIRVGLERWEPRILMDEVEVFGEPTDPRLLRVEIRYRVKRSGVPKSMGITLALEKS